MNILIYLGDPRDIYPVVNWGKLLAQSLQAKLTLLHILSEDETQEHGDEILKRAREQAGEGEVETLLRWGDPTGVLLSEAGQKKYDLLILRYGKKEKALQRLVPLDKVLSQSVFPSVLILREDDPDLKHLLICTGGVEGKNQVIDSGIKLTRAVSAKATILHVTPGSVPTMYTGLVELEETLEDLLQTDTAVARHLRTGAEIMDSHEVEGELQLRRGVPIDEITREVRLGDYDLIVIGRSRVTDGLKEMLLGDVMQQILTQVDISVLVVGEKGFN